MEALSHQAERASKLLLSQQPENHRIISMFKLVFGFIIRFDPSPGNLRTAYVEGNDVCGRDGNVQGQETSKEKGYFRNEL